MHVSSTNQEMCVLSIAWLLGNGHLWAFYINRHAFLYVIVIPWLPGFIVENHALGFGVVFDDKSWQPWYNYYIKECMSIYVKSPKVTITFIHRSKIVVQEMYGLVHISDFKSSKFVKV